MTNGRASWLKLPLLLPLLLLVPHVGLAAQDAPPSDSEAPAQSEDSSTDSRIRGTDERESQRLLDEDESWDRVPQKRKPSMGLRIMAELGAGWLTSLGGSIGGGLIGLGLCEIGGGGSALYSCLGGAGLGFVLGSVFGYPVGVWWGGEAAGGDGSLLAAMAGTAVGGLVAGLLVLVGSALPDPMLSSMFGIVGGVTVLGAPVLGYELSQRRERSQPGRGPSVASSRPRIQPLLSVTSRGAVLGLGGSF